MHPFFSPPDERRPKNLVQLTQNAAELGKALQGPLKALKIWLSEPVFDALESSAKRQDDTVTAWLRGFFAIHCYGVVYVSEIQRLCPAVFKDPEPLRFSLRGPPEGYVSQPVYFVPELGKNTAPVKVWISEMLRRHLQQLADHAGIPLGQYCREIVTARLLGHGTLPMRPAMLEAEPAPELTEWERNDEVKDLTMRRVSEEEYRASRFGRADREWVPEEEGEK